MKSKQDAARGTPLLSFDDLRELYGIRYSRMHLYRLIKNKEFPAPIKLGKTANAHVAFVRDDIEKWIAGRIKAAHGGKAA